MKFKNYSIKVLCNAKIFSIRWIMISVGIVVSGLVFGSNRDLLGANTGSFSSFATFAPNIFEDSKDLNSIIVGLAQISVISVFLNILFMFLYLKAHNEIHKRFSGKNIDENDKNELEKTNKKIWNSIAFWSPFILAVAIFGFSYNSGAKTPDQIDPSKIEKKATIAVEEKMKSNQYFFLNSLDKKDAISNCLREETSSFFVANQKDYENKTYISLECKINGNKLKPEELNFDILIK